MREETERRGGSRRSAPPGEGGGGKMAALRRRDGGWGHRASPERLAAGAGDRQRGALAPPSRAAAAFCPDRQKPDRAPPPVPCRGRAGRPRGRLAAGRSATRGVGDANGRGRKARSTPRAGSGVQTADPFGSLSCSPVSKTDGAARTSPFCRAVLLCRVCCCPSGCCSASSWPHPEVPGLCGQTTGAQLHTPATAVPSGPLA